MNESHTWHVRISGIEYGPYTTAEILAFVDEFRINGESEVRDATYTQGLWVRARVIKPIGERLAKVEASTPKPPPPPTESPPKANGGSQAGIGKSHVASISAAFNRRVRPSEERGFWAFVVDAIDPTFKHYVTPTIVRITWCLAMCMAAAGLALSFTADGVSAVVVVFQDSVADWTKAASDVRPKARRVEPPQRNEAQEEVSRRTAAIGMIVLSATIRTLLVILWLLWLRMALELCIVFFDISYALKANRRNQ